MPGNAPYDLAIPGSRLLGNAEHRHAPARPVANTPGNGADRLVVEHPRVRAHFGEGAAEGQLIEQEFAPLARAHEQELAPAQQTPERRHQIQIELVARL